MSIYKLFAQSIMKDFFWDVFVSLKLKFTLHETMKACGGPKELEYMKIYMALYVASTGLQDIALR